MIVSSLQVAPRTPTLGSWSGRESRVGTMSGWVTRHSRSSTDKVEGVRGRGGGEKGYPYFQWIEKPQCYNLV